MKNEDFFNVVKNKSFEYKLRELCKAIADMEFNSYKASERRTIDDVKEWYLSERNSQEERANWLFCELMKMYHEKGE